MDPMVDAINHAFPIYAMFGVLTRRLRHGLQSRNEKKGHWRKSKCRGSALIEMPVDCLSHLRRK